MTALVLGIGNDWRGDDGAGPEVVRRLRAAGIPAREVGADPCSLIDGWAGAGDVILVDAVRSGAAPGTVHRLAAGAHALPAGLASASTHHVGLAAAVELARALGRLPAALEVYGIEVSDCGAARGLSPAVARAVGEVTAELAARIRRTSSTPASWADRPAAQEADSWVNALGAFEGSSRTAPP